MKANKKLLKLLGLTTITAGLMVGCGVSEEQQTMIDNYPKLEQQVKELQAMVDEAKPWFDMNVEEQKKLEQEQAKLEEERKQKELEAKSVTLGNGNYEAGVDFESGVYDIVAVEGGGNVISSNSFDGGINAIMGSDSKIQEMNELGMGDMYHKEYKNINLPSGTSLKLDSVTVKLIPKQ